MVEMSETQLTVIGTIMIAIALCLIVTLLELKKAYKELDRYHGFVMTMFARLGNKILKDAKNANKDMDSFKNIDDLYMLNYGYFSQAIKTHDYLMEELDCFEDWLKEEEDKNGEKSN